MKVIKTEEPINNIFKTYYEKRMFVSINQELCNKLNEVAKQIADEIMERYEVKQTMYERANLTGNDNGELIITTIMTPKGLNHDQD